MGGRGDGPQAYQHSRHYSCSGCIQRCAAAAFSLHEPCTPRKLKEHTNSNHIEIDGGQVVLSINYWAQLLWLCSIGGIVFDYTGPSRGPPGGSPTSPRGVGRYPPTSPQGVGRHPPILLHVGRSPPPSTHVGRSSPSPAACWLRRGCPSDPPNPVSRNSCPCDWPPPHIIHG